MRRLFAPLAVVAVLAAASLPVMADAVRVYSVDTDKHSPNEVTFTSKASIVKFTGRTAKMVGQLHIDPADTSKASGGVTVDVGSLDTGIGLRNEHMQGTIEAEKYPTASFKLSKLDVPGGKLKANTPVTGTVMGTMTLHGVTRPITAPVELTLLPQQGDGKYRPGDWVSVNTTFKLKLSDYKIALPAPVLGVKVADELTIDFTSMAKAQ